jgi:glucose dehydrogenase
MNGRIVLRILVAFAVASAARQKPDGDWPSFERDPGAQRYSPLNQITVVLRG